MQDIDLLIVYDSVSVSIIMANLMRIELSRAIEASFGLTADICLLTRDEAYETNFVQAEGCELLWLVNS